MHFETPHRRHIRLWYQLFEFWGRPHKKCHTSKNLSISSNNFQTLKFRRYDVIVRMETFFEDSSYLIERYIALLVGLLLATTNTTMNTFYRIYVRSYNSYRTNRCKIFQLEGPAESARAVTGRWCPQSGAGEDFLAHRLVFFFYGNSRNWETKSQKIILKVGNEPSLQGLQTDR